MAELWVGAGKPYASLTSAYAAAKSGDTIFVMAGTYTNETLAIWRDVNIVGVGGMAHFKSTVQIGNGKGIFVVNGDVTFENIEFSGATVRDGNGAGIRYESGDLTIKNSYFHDNQDGILAASSAGGTITIEGSEFARNGKGDGQTHGVYVNQISKLTIVDSYFHDTQVGHSIKSRADSTEIRNNVIDDGQGDSSYNIDLPNGGAATIVGNTIIQSATASNKYMIHYGGEVATPKPGAVLIENNDFIDYRTGYSVGVLNHTSKTIELKQNAFYGVDKDGESGPFTRVDNVTGVLGRSGADAIGTSGLDKVDYAFSPGAVNVNLATGSASDGYGSTDALNGVEHAAGSRFADVITGSSGANWLDGGDGADLMVGGEGNDQIEGGAGTDTAVYSGKAADYRVSLSGGELVVEALNGRTEGVDRLTGVERLRFADGTVTAPSAPTPPAPPANVAPTAAADQATTQSGVAKLIDVLANDADGDGDALAISGLGAPQHGVAVVQNGKVLSTPTPGYAGADSFTYQASDGRGGSATGGVSVTVVAPPPQPAPPPAPQGLTVFGTNAAEVLKGGGLGDLIKSSGGNDVIYARGGDDVVEAGGGNDWLYGADGDDQLYGGSGTDLLVGGAGDDLLDGGAGLDELRGGDGDDTMVWSAGADRYYGGAGMDSILGGAGDDVMLLSSFGWLESAGGETGAGSDKNADMIAETVMKLVNEKNLQFPRGGYVVRRGRGRLIVERPEGAEDRTKIAPSIKQDWLRASASCHGAA